MVKRRRTDDAEQPCPPRLCRRGSADSTACAAVQRIRGLHRRGEPPAAFVASEVLDRAEVAEQLKWASEVGWQFGWGRGDQSANRRRDYRSAFTVEVDDAALAMQLFERIRHAVPAQLTVRTAEQAGGDVSAMGEWHVSGLSARLLYVQYRGGGHFSPHVDGFLVEGMHVRAASPARFLWRNSGAIFSHTQRIDCLFLAAYLTRRRFCCSGAACIPAWCTCPMCQAHTQAQRRICCYHPP
jgi:hypothetical protein